MVVRKKLMNERNKIRSETNWEQGVISQNHGDSATALRKECFGMLNEMP